MRVGAIGLVSLALACAPAIVPCSPESCAGGCCDSRGICVAGLNKHTCGIGGVACASCRGAQVCQQGSCLEPEEDAGGDAGIDAGEPGDAGRLRTVTVRLTDEIAGLDGGVSSQLVDLKAFSAVLLFEDVIGEWVRVDATGPGPAAVFPNVPAGPYFVARGSDLYCSDADEIELGARWLGRREPVSLNTTLSAELSGLTPGFRTGDVVAASSFSSGMSVDVFRSSGDGGRILGTVDVGTQTFPFTLRGSMGDELTVFVRRTVTDGGFSWSSASFAATLPAPQLTAGQSATVTAAVTPLTQVPIEIALRSSDFEQFVTDVNPAATPQATQANVFAIPAAFGANPGGDFEGRSAYLTSFSNRPGGGDLTVGVTVGNPYAGTTLFQEGRSIVSIPLSLSGRTLNRSLEAMGTVQSDGGALGVTLSPPRFLLINGATATVNRMGVGLNPVLEWSPPAIGRPANYLVVISKLTPQGTTLAEVIVRRLRTPFTRLHLPPDILTAGEAYVAIVIALGGAHDANRTPVRATRETGRAAAITNIFVP